ncbi:MAG: hypothetical protein J6I60_02815 [Bacteroidaceae bacterium]|nr:hypothetical protein [Bacteroidaceae bacterium]
MAVDATHFPDPIFRTWVADSVDTDKDGVLSQGECDAVSKLGAVSDNYVTPLYIVKGNS